MFCYRMLNIEITDPYKHHKILISSSFNITKRIEENLPIHIATNSSDHKIDPYTNYIFTNIIFYQRN